MLNKWKKKFLRSGEQINNKINQNLIPSIISKYKPDDHVIFFDFESEKPERMIFEIDGPYLQHEEDHLENFDDFIKSNEKYSDINNYFDRPNKLRFLQGNNYKYKKTAENLLCHIEFLTQKLTESVSEETMGYLYKGLQYNHGRDRHFRPIIVFRASELTDSKINHDEAIKASFYSSFYFIDRLLVPGKVENWNLILDLNSLAISKLPIKFMIKFIQLLQDHEKCRTKLFFVLNVTFAIRLVYRILSPFIDDSIKENLKLSKDNTHSCMLEHIHPSQLEQKYGGDAENLEEYWPPKVISSEYGQDPDFIYEDNLEDASFDHIATPGDLIKSMKSKHRSETCLKTLSFLTKKRIHLRNDTTSIKRAEAAST